VNGVVASEDVAGILRLIVTVLAVDCLMSFCMLKATIGNLELALLVVDIDSKSITSNWGYLERSSDRIQSKNCT
jgi:hypothetical protein